MQGPLTKKNDKVENKQRKKMNVDKTGCLQKKQNRGKWKIKTILFLSHFYNIHILNRNVIPLYNIILTVNDINENEIFFLIFFTSCKYKVLA